VKLLLKEENSLAAAAFAARLLLERGKFVSCCGCGETVVGKRFCSCCGCGETAVGMGVELALLSLLLLLPLGNKFFYYY
jgi:hypothetical protein